MTYITFWFLKIYFIQFLIWSYLVITENEKTTDSDM